MSSIATAADYADAMMTARKAKNLLFLLLLIMLVTQLALFFVARFTTVVFQDAPTTTTRRVVSTQPIIENEPLVHQALHYVIAGIDFLGVAVVIALGIVLLLIVNIMLVGRLIGVARLTSAYVWSIALALLLFPWQAFLRRYAFKIPGGLYTWEEFAAEAHFGSLPANMLVLRWARFVAFPLIAVIILFMIQIKSVRGLRQALGEVTPPELNITA